MASIITNISIKNIKGFGDPATSIDLELKSNRVNIVYAPNGTGKSSIATAFKSLNRGALELDKENMHHKDDALLPELSIILDGHTYSADRTSNSINGVLEPYVINSGIVVSTTQQNIGGRYTKVNGYLDIENIVVVNNIPPVVIPRYRVTDIRADFGVNGKILINREILFKNPNFWKACEKIGQKLDFLPNANCRKELVNTIRNKIEHPINENNKKVIVFSAFADTANYLYENISKVIKLEYNLDTALVTGTGTNRCTLNINKDYNNLLMNFSPISKNREILEGQKNEEIDILIATDCISEGQNLQDCDYLINYDIHWNPVRIIQRFGRIDRIGSRNKVIQLVNFWPNMSLDDYINLKNRVESRMYMLDISATGEDNVLTNQSNDMEYRKEQLQKLKEEVIDLEDMNTGVSITDLGLNDYRMDLLEYIKVNRNLDYVVNGMHSVVPSDEKNGVEKGTIFVLKNINSNVKIESSNQLHPFYIVYIKDNGEVLSSYLNVKNTLDLLRYISKGKKEPIKEAYYKFNDETNDGMEMSKYSELLNKSIESIINVKQETDIESLFRRGGTTMLQNEIKGIEDFELIAFVVIV